MTMHLAPLLLTMALFSVASLASPISSAQAADTAAGPDEDSGTVIHLVQRAEQEMPRDRINASLRVEAEGGDPAKVQAEVNRRMTDALAAAKREPSVKVATSGYSVYQQQPPNKATPTKWMASQSVTLTGKDFGAALNLVGRLQARGLLLDGLSFDLAPETMRSVEDELTRQALKDLRARAERVAAEMGLVVERYKSIDVGNATTPSIRLLPRIMAGMAAAPAPPPAAESGESMTEVSVQAEVVLAPAKAP